MKKQPDTLNRNTLKCKLCNHEYFSTAYFLKNAEVIVCSSCGFHYSSHPDEEEENFSTRFEAGKIIVSDELKYYLRYQLQSHTERFQNQVRLVEKYFPGVSDIKILDVGCGGGKFLALMQKKNAVVYGIEQDLPRMKFAG